jgi:hypothetical protein
MALHVSGVTVGSEGLNLGTNAVVRTGLDGYYGGLYRRAVPRVMGYVHDLVGV